jgi:hypothetical protein
MKISKFTHTKPDSDGDVRLQCTAMIENDSDHDIEFVLISNIIVNSSGATIGGDRTEEEDVFIDAKESGEIDVNCGWGMHEALFEGKPEKTKILVSATTYRREFVKVGAVDIPQDSNEISMLKKDISLGGVAELNGVTVLRLKKDDEGDIPIEIKAGFRNISDTHIERVQLSSKLQDQRDAVIEEDKTYSTLPSKSAFLAEPRFWGLKAGKLKNASVVMTASVFIPIDTYTAQASSTLDED